MDIVDFCPRLRETAEKSEFGSGLSAVDFFIVEKKIGFLEYGKILPERYMYLYEHLILTKGVFPEVK